MSTRAHPWLAPVLLACLLASCAVDAEPVGSGRSHGQATGASRPELVEPSEVEVPRSPQLVQDAAAPVDPDLRRLAKRFVEYADGGADAFPHAESLSLSVGGTNALSLDDLDAVLSDREIWRVCPSHWEVYGAASCPVDLLGPINDAVVNGTSLVYSAEYGAVTCAPTRSGPLPPGRLVVLRPSQEWRTCATDYASSLLPTDTADSGTST